MSTTALATVPQEELRQIANERGDLLAKAHALTITDARTYGRAGELAIAIAELRKSITDKFAVPKKKAHDAHKSICALEKECLEELQMPDRIVRQKLTAWDTEQQRIREEQERAARDKARRDAEEQQLQEAIAAEQRGDTRTAEFLMKTPVIPNAIEMPAAPQRPSGVAYVEKWTYEVKDEAAVPREFLTIDHTKLRKHVELMGESAKVAGVEVFKVKNARIGGRIAEPKPVASETTISAEQVFGD